MRKTKTGTELRNFPYPMVSKLFLYSNAFIAKWCAQTRTFKSVTDKQTHKLETVSIAKPLQNQQHVQTGPNLACNSGPVVYAYRPNLICTCVLCHPRGAKKLMKCCNFNQIFALGILCPSPLMIQAKFGRKQTHSLCWRTVSLLGQQWKFRKNLSPQLKTPITL